MGSRLNPLLDLGDSDDLFRASSASLLASYIVSERTLGPRTDKAIGPKDLRHLREVDIP